MEQNTIKIDIKKHDKVITADGLAGEVLRVCNCSECAERGFYEPLVRYENGTEDYITCNQAKRNFSNFYLIGTTILGNKVEVSEIEQCIEQNKARIAEIKAENDQLRKQAWRLQNAMNGEYVPQNKKDGE